MTPDAQRELLQNSKTIAVVGHSDKPGRTSYQIAQFLRRAGYTVYPVNPSLKEIEGQAVYATLADVPVKIDIVNVFRQSEFLPGVVEEAIAVGAGAVWAQLGVEHAQAAAQAEAAGLPLVMDTCIKVAYLDLL
jgi:predicted CoA-binding protein